MTALKNFFMVLFSPGVVFEEIKEKPSFWLPLVVLLIAVVVFSTASAPIGKEIALKQIEKSANSTNSADMEKAKEMIESPFMTAFSIVGGLFAAVIAVLVQAAILHFVLSAMGGTGTFVLGMAVVLYANVPTIIRQFIEAAYAFKTNALMKTGISGMFSGVEPTTPMGVFLGSIDIFAAWQYVLLAIGCSVAYKVSKGKTAGLAFSLWAVGTIVSVGLAFLGTMSGSSGA
jgi:hypothetical protein